MKSSKLDSFDTPRELIRMVGVEDARQNLILKGFEHDMAQIEFAESSAVALSKLGDRAIKMSFYGAPYRTEDPPVRVEGFFKDPLVLVQFSETGMEVRFTAKNSEGLQYLGDLSTITVDQEPVF